MVTISENIITTMTSSFELDKKAVESIKPLATYQENDSVEDLGDVNKRVQDMFLDFSAHLFINSLKKTTPKLENSENTVSEFLNVDVDLMREEYLDPKDAKTNLAELEDCIKIIVRKIGESNFPALVQLLMNEGYLPKEVTKEDSDRTGEKESKGKIKSILTIGIIEKTKQLTVDELFANKGVLNEVLEEDYTKTSTQSKNINRRNASTTTTTEPDDEDIEYDSKPNNKLLSLVDNSEAIFNPSTLAKHLKVKTSNSKITIEINTYDYLREILMSSNFGDISKPNFSFNTEDAQNIDGNFGDSQVKATAKRWKKNMRGSKNSQIYELLEELISEPDYSSMATLSQSKQNKLKMPYKKRDLVKKIVR